MTMTISISVKVVVEADGDGFYAYCPAFKGLHVGASSHEEALEGVVEALQLYLDSLQRHGDPLPVGPHCIVEDDQPQVPVFKVPAGSTLEDVEVPWPSLAMSGAS